MKNILLLIATCFLLNDGYSQTLNVSTTFNGIPVSITNIIAFDGTTSSSWKQGSMVYVKNTTIVLVTYSGATYGNTATWGFYSLSTSATKANIYNDIEPDLNANLTNYVIGRIRMIMKKYFSKSGL